MAEQEIILDKKALEWAIKKVMLEATSSSKFLREHMSFQEHVKLCEWTSNLTYEQSVLIYIGESYSKELTTEQVGKVRDFESKTKKRLKYGAAAAAGAAAVRGKSAYNAVKKLGASRHADWQRAVDYAANGASRDSVAWNKAAQNVPKHTTGIARKAMSAVGGAVTAHPGKVIAGAGIAVLGYYLFRKFMDPCVRQCIKQVGNKGKVCRYQCQATAAAQVLSSLRSQKGKCNQTNNPEKCLKQLAKQEIKWAKKHQEQLAKLAKAKANG